MVEMGTDRAAMLGRASAMRKAPTEGERRLWNHLRASQLGGHKFRRQATIHNRIVDFFCPTKGLIVEIDGDTHDPEQDAIRDVGMRALGLATLRFSNSEVMENLDGVLQRLLDTLEALPDRWRGSTTPSPSSKEEGGRENTL